jgi:hypothetical protein
MNLFFLFFTRYQKTWDATAHPSPHQDCFPQGQEASWGSGRRGTRSWGHFLGSVKKIGGGKVNVLVHLLMGGQAAEVHGLGVAFLVDFLKSQCSFIFIFLFYFYFVWNVCWHTVLSLSGYIFSKVNVLAHLCCKKSLDTDFSEFPPSCCDRALAGSLRRV